MNVNFLNGEATLTLSEPQEMLMIKAAAVAYAAASAEQAALSKTYTVSELVDRMKMSRGTLFKYLNIPEKQGGIRCRRAGNKFIVSEQAVRDWFGDNKKLNS